ncbi:MAG: autoinducer-2 kinase, partial [Campylobacterota bacterium]|nr:autoinducer-2 kinase [Campylobacterota bacterium]
MSYLLAVDAGTGSVRAVLFDLDGNEVAISQSEWTHTSIEGVENSMGFDYEKNWLLTCRCIQEACADVNKDEIL